MTAPAQTSIDCRHFVEMVTAYLEGALDEQTMALIETHLDICDPCIIYIDQMRQTAAALGKVPLGGLPEDARASLLEAYRNR